MMAKEANVVKEVVEAVMIVVVVVVVSICNSGL